MRFAVRHTTWCALGKEGQEDDLLDSLFKLLFNIHFHPHASLPTIRLKTLLLEQGQQ